MNQQSLFSKDNYKWMIISLSIVLLGYFLMAGGDSNSTLEFNPEQFSAMRISVAPTIIVFGYGLLFFSILKKPVSNHDK